MTIIRATDPRTRAATITARDPRQQEVTTSASMPTPTILNVLVVVIDDVGIEQIAIYDGINGWDGAPYPYAQMPTLAALANGSYGGGQGAGVRFTRFYAAATCSPFRASLLSGLRSAKHRLGTAVNAGEAATLADVAPYVAWSDLGGGVQVPPQGAGRLRTACFGKWHLGRGDTEPASPLAAGRIRRYAGKLENVNVGPLIGNQVQGWRRWRRTNIAQGTGVVTQTDEIGPHAAVRVYTDTLAYLTNQGALEPWVVYVPMHLGHGPYNGAWVTEIDPLGGHPADPTSTGMYHAQGATEPPTPEPIDILRMMLETADTMLGGIMASIPPAVRARTLVICCADNGTDAIMWQRNLNPTVGASDPTGNYPDPQTPGELPRAKGSMFEGGIRTPLIIWGGAQTGVVQGVSAAIVEAPDLYATIADAIGRLGATAPGIDGRSLLPLLRGDATQVRHYQMVQRHNPSGARPGQYTEFSRAVADRDGWKLLDLDGLELLYHLAGDPFEQADRMPDVGSDPAVTARYAALRAELDRVLEEAAEW